MASELKPSQRALAEVLEAIGDAVYAMDRGERILYANRRALELWRKTSDEVIGARLLDVFPGIKDGEPYRAYRKVLATRAPLHLEAIAPALANRWISLDVRPGSDGGLVVVFRDIDDRKRAEAALRDSEERFRSMLEALPQAAFVIRPDGQALYYNRQFRDYVGAPIGLGLADRNVLLHPEDLPKLMEARRDAAAAGVEYAVEARMRRHDGVYRWHRIQNRPMHSDGSVVYWLGTAVDINDIRQANQLLEDRVIERTTELETANRRLAAQIAEQVETEEQLRRIQRMDAIGKLTAGIAHDFNNLLTSIIGNIELLEARMGATDARTERLLGAALSAAERGANLTAQLLAFARQARMNPEPVDLNRIVAEMATLLHSTIGATGRIELLPAKEVWPALADAAQLELVLLNLAINARDAMPNGGTITIATGNETLGPPQRPEEPSAGEYAMVSVADTGLGIPPEIIDKVFDPFFTTKEVGKGSGLGLSQVLGVAQQLKGGVRIVTEPGFGTVVKVYLPRLRAAGAVERRQPASDRRAGGAVDHRTGIILLVDDDDEVRAVAAAMLRDAGHTVIEAGSGGAALERLDQDDPPIEMMVADLAMPGMGGIELAHAARLSRPDLPILFITGFADTMPADGAALGPLLSKPFRAEELNAKVAELLGRRGEQAVLGSPGAAGPFENIGA